MGGDKKEIGRKWKKNNKEEKIMDMRSHVIKKRDTKKNMIEIEWNIKYICEMLE